MHVTQEPEKWEKEVNLLMIADLNKLPMTRPQIIEYFHVKAEDLESVLGDKIKRKLLTRGRCLIDRDLYRRLIGIEKKQSPEPEHLPIKADEIEQPAPVMPVEIKETPPEPIPAAKAYSPPAEEQIKTIPSPIEPKKESAYLNKKEAEAFLMEEMKKEGIPEKNAVFWAGIALGNAQYIPKEGYEPKILNKEASRWCSILKKPTAKRDETLICSPLEITPGKYIDFGLAYPEFFKEMDDALEFVEEVLNFKGMDGKDIVSGEYSDDIQQVVEQSFSPSVKEYRRTSIQFLLHRYLKKKKIAKKAPEKPFPEILEELEGIIEKPRTET